MISKESLLFLSDLKKNNNREWFVANKKRYDAYKEEYQQLIRKFLDAMVPLDESLKHLEVKDCAFRINRDIRFTKDKTPYKAHLPIWMSTGQKNTNLAGYYLHFEKGASFIAGGVYWPDAADLKKIRKEIAFFHEDLEKVVADKKFSEEFGQLDRDETNSLKTAPKDFDKEHPAIEFLKLKCFTATQKIDDKMLADKDGVTKIANKLIALKPLNEFLNRALTSE
ncbi:MAG TPA: DUF2461 domain-containing protein [Flavobacterium sp.]|jgi:uncharacterized protein (TIGR02453 family)|nr:DUF2461 domain-containing protein [Flavobacterium sp.]